MPGSTSTLGRTRYIPSGAVWSLLAVLAGLVFSGMARRSLTWVLLSVVALLIPLVAIFSGNWIRFFIAFMILGFCVNLDKTFNHSGYIGSVAGLALSLVDIGMVILLVSVATKSAITRTFRLRLFLPTTLPALVLLGIMTLSMAAAADVSLSFYQLIEMSKHFVLYLCIANLVQSEGDVRFIVRVLLVGIIFQGSVVILQYLHFFPPELRMSLGFKDARSIPSGSEGVTLFRPAGTIGHANTMGAFLAMTLPVTTSQLMLQSSFRAKLLPLCALAVGTPALVMSFSRGAWISCVVGVVLVLTTTIIRGKRRGLSRNWGVISFLVMAMVVLAFSSLVESRIFSPDRGSVQNRMKLNDMALHMIQENPWLGVGLNMFPKAMADYDVFHFEPQNVVHNVYLLLAAESGVLALVAFIWLLLAVSREGVRGFFLNGPYLSITATGIFGGLVGLWLQMLAEILMSGPPQQGLWFFAGLLAGMNGLPRRDKMTPLP